MFKKLKSRIYSLEQRVMALEGRIGHFEEADEALRRRIGELETAVLELSEEHREEQTLQVRRETAIQDGMDAIFNYAPASMTGGSNG